MSTVEAWFQAADEQIKVQHLRQFAQTSNQMDENSLSDFAAHHLSKSDRNAEDRDKLDFVLVQFFSQAAPVSPDDSSLTIDFVAEALKPVIGAISADKPEFLASLESLLREAGDAHSLNAMFTARIIERGREIKAECGDAFYKPLALAAFVRFGFLIRRRFFRLMHEDLNRIFDGLRKLEARGVATVDCSRAQFAADEPVARLRLICQSWRVMFQAEYSSGQPLCILVDLRTAVETALAHSNSEKPRAMAAAAGASAAEAGVEFEISPVQPASEAD
jgi:hypothetical protein